MKGSKEFYEQGYDVPFADGALPRPSISRIGRALQLLSQSSGSLCDVGCGEGMLLYHSREKFSRLIAVDIAEVQLRKVAAWATAIGASVECHAIDLDAEGMPIPPGTIDAAICLVLLEFVFAPQRVVREIASILKPNGILIVSVGNIVSLRNRLRVLWGLEPRTTTFSNAVNGGAMHSFSGPSIRALLEANGFVVDYVGCSGRLWRLRSLWPSLLGGDILIRCRKSR